MTDHTALHVLVATDGSGPARAAVEFVADRLALLAGVRVTAVVVNRPCYLLPDPATCVMPLPYFPLVAGSWTTCQRAHEQAVARLVAEVTAQLTTGQHDVRVLVSEGRLTQVFVAVTAHLRPDLLVLGCPQSRWWRLPWRQPAAALARATDCPVVVVSADAPTRGQQPSRSAGGFRCVRCRDAVVLDDIADLVCGQWCVCIRCHPAVPGLVTAPQGRLWQDVGAALDAAARSPMRRVFWPARPGGR